MLMVHSAMAAMTGAGFGGSDVKQVAWTEPGVYSWTVPAGVLSICAVAIGVGGVALNDRSGGGGALAYANSIAVTPGESLTITVTPSRNDGTAVSSLHRGATALVDARGGTGSTGGPAVQGAGNVGGSGSSGAGGANRSGGGAGGYTSAGGNATTATTNPRGGGGSSPNGGGAGAAAGGAADLNGGQFGGGAGKLADGTLGAPGPGCVRIILGEGRAFPNTNTGDL